jgi:hypothetical protein
MRESGLIHPPWRVRIEEALPFQRFIVPVPVPVLVPEYDTR